LFEPSQWADLFKRSGARYAFLTSNFHDGYCLWPSPFRPGWNSRDVGPKRDLLGDFSRAMRDAGLRAGFYCSLGEFDHPLYVKAQENGDLEPFVRAHMQPQLREAMNRYSPSFSSFLSRRARPPFNPPTGTAGNRADRRPNNQRIFRFLFALIVPRRYYRW